MMKGRRILAAPLRRPGERTRYAGSALSSGATGRESHTRERPLRLLRAGGDIAARWPYLLVLVGFLLAGCVSKGTAEARARAAFMAGQQQQLQQQAATMARQSQIRGPTVTVLGPVRNSLVPWTADLTLAKAVLAAEYYGPRDPSVIIIQRGGKEFSYDPKTLLSGQDIPLDPNDVVEISP